eukprot:139202-Alexandrium_andersonii.AAC.1
MSGRTPATGARGPSGSSASWWITSAWKATSLPRMRSQGGGTLQEFIRRCADGATTAAADQQQQGEPADRDE